MSWHHRRWAGICRERIVAARARMFELEEQIVDVPGHAESAAPALLIPVDGDAGKFVPGHVELDTIVFLE